MAEFYLWFVFAHLAGLVLFAISHGASAFMAFRLRSAPDVPTARALLAMGQLSIGPMYVGLLLLIIGGLGAAFAGDLWGRPWLIASVVVFIAVLIVMWAVASPYYMRIRKSIEDPAPDGTATMTWDDLKGQLDTRRPDPVERGNHRAPATRLVDGDQARRLGRGLRHRSREPCIDVDSRRIVGLTVFAFTVVSACASAGPSSYVPSTSPSPEASAAIGSSVRHGS